jgi:hypothetical protein
LVQQTRRKATTLLRMGAMAERTGNRTELIAYTRKLKK